MPPLLLSLSQRDVFPPQSRLSHTDNPTFLKKKKRKSSVYTDSEAGKLSICGPMYTLQEGSGLFLLAVLAGLQVMLFPSGFKRSYRRTLLAACCSCSDGVCRVASSTELLSFKRAVQMAYSVMPVLQMSTKFDIKRIQNRAVIIIVTPLAVLANRARC